jgi:uncharacterized protein (DUF983 family)
MSANGAPHTTGAVPTLQRRSWLAALLRRRCPKCREGQIFKPDGLTDKACPLCGLSFEREEGYFLGAMYFSYFLAGGFLIACYFAACLLLPDWPREWVAGLAIVLLLPFVPLFHRYSRVLWIYYDRWAWPGSDFRDPPPVH